MQAAFEKEGMTLIEVLISLAILVLIAAYFLTAITSGTSWISKAGKTTQAVNVASAIIEDIKANANRINAGTYSDNMLNISVKDGGLALSSDYSKFRLEDKFSTEVIIKEVYLKNGVITETTSDMSTNLLEVQVKITGQEQGRDYAEELTAVISRK